MKINLKKLWKRIKNGLFVCSKCEKSFTSMLSKRQMKKQFKKEFPDIKYKKNNFKIECEHCCKIKDKKIKKITFSVRYS